MNGKQLQKAIDALGLNQSSLARLIDMSPRRVRYWIADEREVPTVVVLLLYAMLDKHIKPEQLREE
jgi:transcriptional regulator with XRE-family HTH domain